MHQAKGIKSSDAKLRSSEGEFFPGKVLQEARQGKVSDFESSHLFLAQAVFGEHFQQCVIWDSFEVRGTQIPLKGHGKNKTWQIYTWISNILVWAAFLGFQQKRKDAETAQDLHGHTFPSLRCFSHLRPLWEWFSQSCPAEHSSMPFCGIHQGKNPHFCISIWNRRS